MKRIIILSCVVLMACSGCAWFQRQTLDVAPQPKQEGPNQVFYGFPDVPIPKELSLVSDRSFVYETSVFKAGVLVFNGNVDLQSLENYFKINMPKNGWRYVNSFRYKESIINYVKDDKICNIRMSRGAFSSDVEIWVGPAEKGSIQRSNEGAIK
jgi:hypothetical protein